jgi:hypothetical protein
MGQLGQSPKPSEHARFLKKRSVAGGQVDFVHQSTYSPQVLTLQAAGNASNLDFGYFVIAFNYTVNGRVYPWGSVLSWQYTTFYVDGTGLGSGFDTSVYRLGTAVTGTTAANRKTMNIDIYGPHQLYIPEIDYYNGVYSNVNAWYLRNYDSSSHIIGLAQVWKYILTGGPNGEES